MTAGCITFEEIESRAESTLALAIHARRIKENFLAHTIGFPVLVFLNRKLFELTRALKTPALEKCNDEQLTEVADLLRQVHAWLEKLLSDSQQSGLYRLKVMRKQFKRIEDSTEDIESIVENINLAINPTFHKVVSSAIAQLNVGVDENAALLR